MSAAGLLVVVAQLCASLGKSLRVIGVEFGGRGWYEGAGVSGGFSSLRISFCVTHKAFL
jgi:hypothetical protein